MQNKKLIGIFSFLVFLPTFIFSIPSFAGNCSSGSIAEQMSCLTMQNAILKERLSEAKLVKSIEKAKESKKTTVKRKLGLPYVVSTYGVGDHLTAVLVWIHDNQNIGRMITVDGSSIPGGWTVDHIGNGTVTIKKGDKIETLLLSSGNSGSGQIGLTGLPEKNNNLNNELPKINKIVHSSVSEKDLKNG